MPSRFKFLMQCAWAAFITGILAISAPVYAQNTQPIGLRIVQSVVDPAQPTFTVDSKAVPIAFGASAIPATVDREGTTTNHIIQVPALSYGVGALSSAQILAQSKNILTTSRAQDVGNKLKVMIAEGKFSSGVFLFNQDIRPRGSNRNMRLVWMVTVTDDGRVFIQEPRITDPDPTVLYMFYTSNNVDDALPPQWKHDGGGMLMWQVRKPDGTPVTDYVTINTGGAFDTVESLQADGTMSADEELMPNCLANRAFNAACPKSFPDAATLMDDTASKSAIIDYGRKVKPVYREIEDSETGEVEYRPIFSLSIDAREYHRTTCAGGSYRNAGRKGFLLETAVDRYFYTADLSHVLLSNRYSKQDVSPTENFDVSMNVDHTETGLRQFIVDPFEVNKLAGLGAYPEIMYVAPLRNTNTITAGNNVTITSSPGDSPAVWRSVDNTRYQFHFGTSSDNMWGGGTHDRVVYFNISNKNFFTSFNLSHVHFNDWLMVHVNGVLVYNGPRGGDRLNIVVTGGKGSKSSRTRVENCAGCRNSVSQGQTSSPVSINILPYLKNGTNSISIRNIVSGAGEGRIRLDAGAGEGRIRLDALSCLEN